MPKRRVSIYYWKLDARQFAFWFTVAFIAGSAPNLADEVHPLFLLAIWLLAMVAGLILWLKDKRKSGIGVYIHLPRPGDTPQSIKVTEFLHEQMARHHRDWFRSGPDDSQKSLEDRVDWTVKTIRHRLEEAELQASGTPPLSVYLHCRLEEAFALGRRIAQVWNHHERYAAISDDSIESATLNLDFRVKSLSVFNKDKVQIHEINLQELQPTGPISGLLHLEQHENLSARFKISKTPLPRLGIILYAAQSPGRYQAFRDKALEAAAGVASNGYMIYEDDRCDNAISLSLTADEFYNSLRGGSSEKYVQAISATWTNAANQIYGTPEVPVRVFMQGPSILAFALGAFLPDGSRLVPYDANVAAAQLPREGAAKLIAIIDGDDIGSGMENLLLSNSLNEAIAYSKEMDQLINVAVESMKSVPGVTLRSFAGDSAIFELEDNSIAAFEDALDRVRSESILKISCGYGTTTHEAYTALRIAKTTGKNITVGSGDLKRKR